VLSRPAVFFINPPPDPPLPMTARPPRDAAALGHESASLAARARPVTKGPDLSRRIRRFVVEAARLANDLHCRDGLVLDIRGLSDVTDYLLIATGTSDRQILSVGRDIEELAEQYGLSRFGRNVDGPTTWLVLDFVDVVVHLFDANARAYYDLEMMWGDAGRVSWRRGADGDGDGDESSPA
jgi:ribosome-associated protein